MALWRMAKGKWRSMCGVLQEISQFVAANWVELQDFETGSNYYYNQITHRTQFDKPVQPQKARLPSLGPIHALLLRSEFSHVDKRAVMRRLPWPTRAASCWWRMSKTESCRPGAQSWRRGATICTTPSNTTAATAWCIFGFAPSTFRLSHHIVRV